MEKALEILKNWKLTDVTYGPGVISEVGARAKEFGSKAIVVIGQGSVKKHGYLDALLESLGAAGVRAKVVEGVEPNPSKETIYRLAYYLLADSYDCAIALGGGSTIDALKGGLILATVRDGDIDEYFGVGNASRRMERMDPPMIAIPTTSGTSAEVTKYSNITDPTLRVKKLISDPAIIPQVALVDPELTLSCPPGLTATVGLDTLTHLMEGYMNNVHDGVDPGDETLPGANERALEGMRLLFGALPEAVRDGSNLEAREKMSLACVLGGTVIVYKSTGGPHMNSFSWFDLMPHGNATGLMLPYYTAYYAPAIEGKLRKVAALLGVDAGDNVGKAVAEGLLEFYGKLGFPTTLREVPGFTGAHVDKAIADAAQNQMKLDNMPRPIPAEKKNEVLRVIIEGARDGDLSRILEL
ncbi:MAG: iron-containing alcohol dehydrogenase family protein [Promethearchaeota archaeon]